jgi:hypothetical protein
MHKPQLRLPQQQLNKQFKQKQLPLMQLNK